MNFTVLNTLVLLLGVIIIVRPNQSVDSNSEVSGSSYRGKFLPTFHCGKFVFVRLKTVEEILAFEHHRRYHSDLRFVSETFLYAYRIVLYFILRQHVKVCDQA